MANLAAYIDFSAVLSKSGSTSTLILTDPNNYPGGVDVDLLGYFVITQPDTITITGNYITPDIYWTGSALSIANKELRLTAVGGFEQGTYTITYHIVATGYDETTLTKTFDLTYTNPTITLVPDFDVFVPTLLVSDSATADYVQTGMILETLTKSWAANIITVEGTPQSITSSLDVFNLAYLGSYYDSEYDVFLTVTLIYLMDPPNDWVSINDTYTVQDIFYAFIPPTLLQLLGLLTAYKAALDAKNCICGPGCVCNCSTLISTYSLAVSIYSHIVERGRMGDTDGLSAYVLQLQKLLSNCVTPEYTNTNDAIPPYDWGSTGGTTFIFYKQMIVGSGVNNAPANGATTYTDSNLIGKSVIVYLDSLLMGFGLNDRVSITYNSTTGTITWNTSLYSPQLISIYTFS